MAGAYVFFDVADRDAALAAGKDRWACKVGHSFYDALARARSQFGSHHRPPCIGLLLRTRDGTSESAELERYIHAALRYNGRQATESCGREWFITNPAEVLAIAQTISSIVAEPLNPDRAPRATLYPLAQVPHPEPLNQVAAAHEDGDKSHANEDGEEGEEGEEGETSGADGDTENSGASETNEGSEASGATEDDEERRVIARATDTLAPYDVASLVLLWRRGDEDNAIPAPRRGKGGSGEPRWTVDEEKDLHRWIAEDARDRLLAADDDNMHTLRKAKRLAARLADIAFRRTVMRELAPRVESRRPCTAAPNPDHEELRDFINMSHEERGVRIERAPNSVALLPEFEAAYQDKMHERPPSGPAAASGFAALGFRLGVKPEWVCRSCKQLAVSRGGKCCPRYNSKDNRMQRRVIHGMRLTPLATCEMPCRTPSRRV